MSSHRMIFLRDILPVGLEKTCEELKTKIRMRWTRMICRENWSSCAHNASRIGLRLLAGTGLILLISSGAWGQKNKNKKPDTTPIQGVPLPVSDQIDHDIGEMLGAFQVGNVEAMHKYYSDNVTFVSGTYGPPILGWQNYVTGYQQSRAAFQGMQLIRRNTDIFVHGDVAWASYQWEFSSVFNGKPYGIRGQTTLVLNKVADNWLIVHNHTSQLCEQSVGGQQPPATPAPVTPAAPKEAPKQ
jgi:ketosteroid isomerase-like protein